MAEPISIVDLPGGVQMRVVKIEEIPEGASEVLFPKKFSVRKLLDMTPEKWRKYGFDPGKEHNVLVGNITNK